MGGCRSARLRQSGIMRFSPRKSSAAGLLLRCLPLLWRLSRRALLLRRRPSSLLPRRARRRDPRLLPLPLVLLLRLRRRLLLRLRPLLLSSRLPLPLPWLPLSCFDSDCCCGGAAAADAPLPPGAGFGSTPLSHCIAASGTGGSAEQLESCGCFCCVCCSCCRSATGPRSGVSCRERPRRSHILWHPQAPGTH
jgi:hypothetical protein